MSDLFVSFFTDEENHKLFELIQETGSAREVFQLIEKSFDRFLDNDYARFLLDEIGIPYDNVNHSVSEINELKAKLDV